MSDFDRRLLELLSQVDSRKGEYINPYKLHKILEVIDDFNPEIENIPELSKLRDKAYDEANGMFGR
jgi:hypothetical protein